MWRHVHEPFKAEWRAVGGSSLKDSNLHLNGRESCKAPLKGNYLNAQKKKNRWQLKRIDLNAK